MSFENICIYGAGALGGSMAVKLALHHPDRRISVVARGPHLDAIRRDGLRLTESDHDTVLSAQVTATDRPDDLPPQDLIITGLKGHQLPPAAAGIARLLQPHTRVMNILNGIPWWYFHADKQSGREGTELTDLDPGGVLWRSIGPQRVIGCVALQGAEVTAPGHVHLSNRGRYVIGEPSGENSRDLAEIQMLLSDAGLSVSTSQRIRDEIWMKLMGNAAFNPISALTRATMHDIMQNGELAAMVEAIMNEVRVVGEDYGARFSVTVAQRLDQSRQIGNVRSSMLQDLLAGKSLELTPLVGMVVKLGELAGIATPVLAHVSSLAKELDRQNSAATA